MITGLDNKQRQHTIEPPRHELIQPRVNISPPKEPELVQPRIEIRDRRDTHDLVRVLLDRLIREDPRRDDQDLRELLRDIAVEIDRRTKAWSAE